MSSPYRRKYAWVLALAIVGVSTISFGARRVSAKQISGVVNLNAASMGELDLLPGVGTHAAQKIIEYRKKTPFTRPEELVKVKGFGRKKYEKLKPYLTISGPTTITDKTHGAKSTLHVTSLPRDQQLTTRIDVAQP